VPLAAGAMGWSARTRAPPGWSSFWGAGTPFPSLPARSNGALADSRRISGMPGDLAGTTGDHPLPLRLAGELLGG